jgi:hypothetical protein
MRLCIQQLANSKRQARLLKEVVPKPQQFQLFCSGQSWFQRIALEKFVVLHHPIDGVVNVVRRMLVAYDESGKFCPVRVRLVRPV